MEKMASAMNFSFVRVSAWKFKTKLETGIIRYDEIHRFHAIDVIAACGKCGRAAASRKMNKMLRGNRLFESDFVRFSCGNKKTEITLVGFRSLLKLIMVLPKAWAHREFATSSSTDAEIGWLRDGYSNF
jgi:bacterioferritin-associated ferredoxin